MTAQEQEQGGAGMPDMSEMMKMLGKGGASDGGDDKGGMPDMSSLMSMLGGGKGDGEGDDSMAQMMSMLGGKGGGMGDKGGMMGDKGGMMGGKGGMMGGGKGGPAPDEGEKQCDGFVWEQKGEEIQVRFDKTGLTKKDIKVSFKRKTLKVELAGEVVVDGELHGAVEADECCWSIEPDTKQCQVMLTKQDEKSNWVRLMA